MRLPKPKIVLLLTGLIVIGAAFFFFRSRAKIIPGEIEARLAAGGDDNDIPLQSLIRHFEGYDLPDSLYVRIERTLGRQQFLTKKDLLTIQQLLAVQDSSVRSDTLLSLFQNNKYDFYLLITHLLNHAIYLKEYASQSMAWEDEPFKLIEWLISNYDDPAEQKFLQAELQFYRILSEENLDKKLLLERLATKCHQQSTQNQKVALQYFGSGIKIAHEISDRKKEIDLLTLLQLINYRDGHANLALDLGDYLLSEVDALSYTIKTAQLHFFIGHCYLDMGLFEDACGEYQKAQDIYKQYNHTEQITRMHERMGVVNRRLSKFDVALKNYAQAFDLLNKFNSYTDIRIDCLIGLGVLYAELGKPVKADSLYQEALRLSRQFGDTTNQAIALGDLGELQLDLGDYQKAQAFTLEAYTLTESHGDPHTLASLSTNLIEILVENGRFDDAKTWAERTTDYLSNFGFDLLKAETFLNVGKMDLEIGNEKMALASFSKALKIAEDKVAIAQQLESLNLIAETHRRLGNLTAAGESIEKSLQLIGEYPFQQHKWTAHFYLGNINRDAGENSAAENEFSEAIRIVKGLASEIKDNEQRSSFSEKIQPLFEAMVLLQLQQGNDTVAFRFAEQERAQVFKILLGNIESDSTAGPIMAGFGGAPQSEGFNLLAMLQSQLKANEIVVEYEMTDSCLVAWAISRDKFETEEIAVRRDSLDRWVAQFRAYTDSKELSKPTQIRQNSPKMAALCKKLYHALLSPIAPYLGDSTLIYFIPDETLNYLSFAAFMPDEENFLIESHPIVMQLSAEILYDLLVRERAESGIRQRLLTVATNPDLIHSFEETREVARHYPDVDTLVGPSVTESDVQQKLKEPFDVILFSVHGKADEKRPYFSSLLLKAETVSGAPAEADQQLSVSEIQGYELSQTSLVYLSSCESASGRLYRGEGIVGLQRAFLIAGAHSVIAHLWKVEDRRAMKQTVAFFANWAGNQESKAVALQEMFKTQITDLKKNGQAHPGVWASVTLAGNPN